jgi:hypothetical protein
LPPRTKLKRKGLSVRGGTVRLPGSSRDRGKSCPSGVDRVQVSLARVKGRTGVNCRFLRFRTGYAITDAQNCRRPVLFTPPAPPRGFVFDLRLRPGLYRVQARGTDKARNKETPRKCRNIVLFEVE